MVSLCLRTAVATCGQRGKHPTLFLVHAGLALFNSSLTLETQTLLCCPVNSRCTVRTSPQALPGCTVEVSEKAPRQAYTIYPTPLTHSCAPSALPRVCVMALVLFKVLEPHLHSPAQGQHSGCAPLLGDHAICICGCLFHIFTSCSHFLFNPTARSGD